MVLPPNSAAKILLWMPGTDFYSSLCSNDPFFDSRCLSPQADAAAPKKKGDEAAEKSGNVEAPADDDDAEESEDGIFGAPSVAELLFSNMHFDDDAHFPEKEGELNIATKFMCALIAENDAVETVTIFDLSPMFVTMLPPV